MQYSRFSCKIIEIPPGKANQQATEILKRSKKMGSEQWLLWTILVIHKKGRHSELSVSLFNIVVIHHKLEYLWNFLCENINHMHFRKCTWFFVKMINYYWQFKITIDVKYCKTSVREFSLKTIICITYQSLKNCIIQV